ncbi:hypothetical protein EBH_0072000 [Eimeria brunetti]|uniref:Uncharacterized protein n=1 Tax=Eimeria brunetti TaxID=51314 RepID=U6LUM0_9EIME|nr:hypothetical protein EBH_0072000 [Eimeria brunetti]
MSSVSYAIQETWSRQAYPSQRSPPSRPRSRKVKSLSLPTFLATTISVAAILLSLSTCKALRTRHQFSGVTRRRLSEGDKGIDEDERSVIEGCLDLEEELGIIEGRAISSSEVDSLNRVTALVSMLSEEAVAKETMQEPLPVGGQLRLTQQWLDDPSGFDPKYSEVIGQHSPLQASAELLGATGGTPALDPDSWIDSIPSINNQPEGQKAVDSFRVSDGNSKAGQASGVSASTGQHPAGLSHLLHDVQSHPYVRLPVLEKGVVPRNLRVSILFTQKTGAFSFNIYMRTMRKLLLKKSLNQIDANTLVGAVEKLVTSSWVQSRKGARGRTPIYFVEALGRYFISLDAIVCASQILGDCMQLPLWWETFVASFNTNFPLYNARSRANKLTDFHIDFARRLIAALDIYKTGRRPALTEVIALKRLLFCFPLGRHRFKGPKWDSWREDGGCY